MIIDRNNAGCFRWGGMFLKGAIARRRRVDINGHSATFPSHPGEDRAVSP